MMNAMASQITGISIVYWAVYIGAYQRKHRSSATLAFVRGIHRWRVNSPYKGPVTWKIFPFDDGFMLCGDRETSSQAWNRLCKFFVSCRTYPATFVKIGVNTDSENRSVDPGSNGLKVTSPKIHYNDVIMSAMASQITSHTIVYSIVYSGTNERKHQSSASLAFVGGIHQGPVNSPHKGPVTRKMFPFDDVFMF